MPVAPPYYQAVSFLHPGVPVAAARQGLLGNLITAVGGIINPGSQEGQNNNQRPNEDGSAINQEDVQAIWISGFPVRSAFPGPVPVWQVFY